MQYSDTSTHFPAFECNVTDAESIEHHQMCGRIHILIKAYSLSHTNFGDAEGRNPSVASSRIIVYEYRRREIVVQHDIP